MISTCRILRKTLIFRRPERIPIPREHTQFRFLGAHPSSRPPATQTPSARSGLRSTFQTQAPRSGYEANFPTMLEESYALESRTRIFPGKANAAARLLAVGGARAAVCSFVQATTDFPKEMFPFQTFVIFLPPYWLWPESVRLLPDRHSRTFVEVPPWKSLHCTISTFRQNHFGKSSAVRSESP